MTILAKGHTVTVLLPSYVPRSAFYSADWVAEARAWAKQHGGTTILEDVQYDMKEPGGNENNNRL